MTALMTPGLMMDPLTRYLRDPRREYFETLVRDTAPAIYGAAYRVLGDRQIAEDVTQEVFMKFFDAKAV